MWDVRAAKAARRERLLPIILVRTSVQDEERAWRCRPISPLVCQLLSQRPPSRRSRYFFQRPLQRALRCASPFVRTMVKHESRDELGERWIGNLRRPTLDFVECLERCLKRCRFCLASQLCRYPGGIPEVAKHFTQPYALDKHPIQCEPRCVVSWVEDRTQPPKVSCAISLEARHGVQASNRSQSCGPE